MSNRPTSFQELPLVMTAVEVAKVLGIGRNQAYELVKEGRLSCVRVGSRVLIPRAEVEKLLGAAGD